MNPDFIRVIRGFNYQQLPARFAFVAIVVAIAAAATAVTTTAAAATTITTVTAAATATSTICSWFGFVDGQIASAKIFAIKSLDGCCCLFRGCHFHKSKAA